MTGRAAPGSPSCSSDSRHRDQLHRTPPSATDRDHQRQPNDSTGWRHQDWIVGPDPVVATVATDPFELFRALGGRRSEPQIRSLAWTGDADAVVPLVSRYPLPGHPLTD